METTRGLENKMIPKEMIQAFRMRKSFPRDGQYYRYLSRWAVRKGYSTPEEVFKLEKTYRSRRLSTDALLKALATMLQSKVAITQLAEENHSISSDSFFDEVAQSKSNEEKNNGNEKHN